MKLPMPAPQLDDLWHEIEPVLPRIVLTPPVLDGEYLHWDQLRHRTPPAGLTHRQWWAGIKLARQHLLKAVPLADPAGLAFHYGVPDPVLKLLHGIDRDAAGGIQMAEEVTNPNTRDRYIINSLIEESITSSQLEGASTTSDVAKEMIRSGRRPADRSEQMIVNNYAAMRFVQDNARKALTPDMVFTLHRIVTDETLDDPSKAGRFREHRDNVIVEDGTGTVLHVPPPAQQLGNRLEAMCRFANEGSAESFIHPVIRAMILHFWVGYDHPFVDGNGRTARALFYWSMLAQGYWLAEYVSISRILRKAPGQYSRSFAYTEADGNDLTYFLLYQLGVLRRAIAELQDYLRRKMTEVRQVETLLRSSADFNHRQLALLSHALKHAGHRYTIRSHQQSHNVVYQTARTDLLDLAGRGLLIQRRAGRSFTFAAPGDLARRLATLTDADSLSAGS
jgi:Fic family protein